MTEIRERVADAMTAWGSDEPDERGRYVLYDDGKPVAFVCSADDSHEQALMLNVDKAIAAVENERLRKAEAAIGAMMAPWLARYNAGENGDPRFNGMIDGAGLALQAVRAALGAKP